jgi:hypothetical protein
MTTNSNPVVFVVPLTGYNPNKSLPKDGELTTENITYFGTDTTNIVIPAGVTYNSNSSTNYQSKFTGSSDNSKKFTIEFPANTVDITSSVSGSNYTAIYQTPSKIQYKFTGVISNYTKTTSGSTATVATGLIDIVPVSNSSSNVKTNTNYTPESLEKMVKEKADAAGKDVASNIEKVIYENFNQNFLNLIYTVLKDFLVIIVMWLIILSLGVWGTVDKDFVHPIDVTKYPYTYNDGDTINNLTDFIPTESGVFCGKLDTTEISKISTTLRDKLQKDPELREKLQFINPTMAEITQKNVYTTSKKMHSSCSQTGSYSNALSVFLYWLNYLIFTQTVFQNYILNGFHSILNSVVKITSGIFNSEGYAASIALAILIFFMMQAVQPTLDMIQKLILKKKTISGDRIDKPENVFIYAGMSALSVVLFIAIPMFFILFMVGLLGHVQSILRIIFESNSVECAFLSVITLTATVVSFFQVLSFMITRGTKLISISAVEEQITKLLNFSSLYKIISNGAGVGIPLALALLSAFVISFRILYTCSYVLKNNIELLKNLSPAIMLLLFYYLYIHVKNILGTVQAYITIGVISFFGFYFLTKK